MKQESGIRFSILVPVYNVADYIEDCIYSVLVQTYTNYELILVDDGSTDESGNICDGFANNYSQIKVFHKKNRGLIHTRRFALQYATGDYFLMLDSDDMLEKDALEIINDTIEKHQCDCVFYNRKQLIDNKIVEASYHLQAEYVTDKQRLLRKALIEMPYNGIVLKCAKASLFSGTDYSSYYHIQKGEDLLQSLELLKNCNTAEFIDNQLYIYRKRSGSISNHILKEDYKIDFTVRKLTLRYLQRENVLTDEDWNDYRDKCIVILIDQIIEICSLNTQTDYKLRLLDAMFKDPYYYKFLRKGITDRKRVGYKSAVYYLFKFKLFYILINTIAVYSRV